MGMKILHSYQVATTITPGPIQLFDDHWSNWPLLTRRKLGKIWKAWIKFFLTGEQMVQSVSGWSLIWRYNFFLFVCLYVGWFGYWCQKLMFTVTIHCLLRYFCRWWWVCADDERSVPPEGIHHATGRKGLGGTIPPLEYSTPSTIILQPKPKFAKRVSMQWKLITKWVLLIGHQFFLHASYLVYVSWTMV